MSTNPHQQQPTVGPYGPPYVSHHTLPYAVPVSNGAAAWPPAYPIPSPYGSMTPFVPQMQYGPPPLGWNLSPAPPPSYYDSCSTVKSFFIRSRHNGFVFDVQEANPAPGNAIITCKQKDQNNSSQLWFEDSSTGTIRSKLNQYCIDIDGDSVVTKPYQPGNPNQLWEYFGNMIRNRHQPSKVLTVDASKPGSGGKILVCDQHQKKYQNAKLFDYQFISLVDSNATHLPPRRRFFIVSEMNCKVLDVRGANPCSGTDVIMWPRKSTGDNQLWYFDNQGVIRSAFNDMALDSGVGGQKIRMMPYTGEARQQWHLVGNKIVNNAHECLDIRGESKRDGAELISYQYKGSANQHWRIEYFQ